MTQRNRKSLGIASILLATLLVLTSFPVFADLGGDDTGISIIQVTITSREGEELGTPVARDLEITLGFSYNISPGEHDGGEFVIRVPEEIALEGQEDFDIRIGTEPLVDALRTSMGYCATGYTIGDSGAKAALAGAGAENLDSPEPVYATVSVDVEENTITIFAPAYEATGRTTGTIEVNGRFSLDGQTEGNTRLVFAIPSGNKTVDIHFASPDGTYIDKVEIERMVDGTAPFDADNKAGNDANSNNGIVRTFDTVSYTIGFNIASSLNLTEAVVNFKFFLPYSSQTAIFDTDSMGWIENLKQTEDSSGQTLTGKYTLKSNSGIVAPGAGTIEAIVKVLYAVNEDEIQPEFTLWMEGNTEEQERTVKPDAVTVSAAPKYNIKIARNTYLEYRDEFNLTKGNSTDKVDNDETDEIVEGYMHGYGIAFQLYNDNVDKGLKGIELPTGEITFDLNVKLEEKPAAAGSVAKDITDEYTPILWDYKRNTTATKGDDSGRNMIWNEYNWTLYAAQQVPFVGTSASYSSIASENAGTIKMEQQDNIITVKLSGYDFTNIVYPTHNAAASLADTLVYGVNIGTFSAGYLQLLVQVPEIVAEDTNYNLTVLAENLKMKSLSGQEMQFNGQMDMDKGDDGRTYTMILKPKGAFDTRNTVTSPNITAIHGSYYLSSSYMAGDAWASPGDLMMIWGGLISGSANDKADWARAIDILQKFDDRAFLIPAGSSYNSSVKDIAGGYNDMQHRVLYAAKPDKTGWTDEDELVGAEAKDLVYFTSIDELTARGYTCVALLYELRDGYMTSGGTVNMGINLQVRDTAEVGKVYITSNAVSVWTLDYPLPADATRLTDGNLEELYEPRWSRVNSGYTATVYHPDGTMSGHNGSWTYGQSLLIIGVEASLEKGIAQRSSGLEKTNFNVGQGERQVDYVLRPSVAMANGQMPVNGKTTTVTVTDTLPKDLTYIDGSSLVGGTYSESAGVTGGTASEPAVTQNSNGTTALVWVFEDVPVGEAMGEIHFSCLIGNLEDLEKDVVHNQQIVNTALIHAVGDDRAVGGKGVNKQATATLQVTKLDAASLVKRVEKTRFEIGEDITYHIYFSNASDSAVTNAVLLDILPYFGDGRQTDMVGKYTIKDVSISLSKGDASGLKVLFSGDTAARSLTAAAFNDSLFTEWAAGGNKSATALAVTGDIPATSTLILTYTLEIDKDNPNTADDTVSNNASIIGTGITGTVTAPTVSSKIVGRSISGLVWLDSDEDGYRDGGEELVEGVKVTLHKDGLEITEDILGNPFGTVITDSNGEYRFDNLPAGQYTVYFDSTSEVKLEEYGISVYQAKGVSSDRNNDAKPVRNADGTLDKGYIANISLPSASQIGSGKYEAAYLDMGLTTPSARLAIDKTSDPESGEEVKDGDTITYFLTVTNEGVLPATNIEIIDTIPTFTTYVPNSASDNGDYDPQSGIITWTIAELKAGESKTVSFQVTVDEMEEGGTREITNVAQVNGEDTPPTEHPQEKDGPKLSAVKLSNPASGSKVVGGDVITYTIMVSNNGDAVAKDVEIRDSIPEYTDYRNGSASPGGQYDEETGVITWTIDRIEPDDYAEVSFSVKVQPMEDVGTRYIRNVAQVNGKDTPGTEHPQDPDYPDVKSEKRSNPASGEEVAAGQEITYSIVVRNEGTAPTYDLVIADTVPAFTEYVKGSNTSTEAGAVFALTEAEEETALEWTLEKLEPGEVWTVSFKVTVEEIEPGTSRTIRNVAQVSHDGGEPEEPPGTEHPQEEPLGPKLSREKSSNPISGSKVEAGDTITYSVKVKNVGDETAKDVVIFDQIPQYTSYVEHSADHNGIYLIPGRVLTWMIGDLEPGEEVTVSFRVMVEEMKSAGKREIKNIAQVGYDSKDPENTNETDHFQEKEQGPIVNAIKRSNPVSGSTVSAGDTITYTIAVTNSGDTSAEDVMVSDSIPQYTDYVANSASNGGIHNSDTKTITWELGTLEPGKTVQVSFQVKVQSIANNTERTIRNVAQYSHDGGDAANTNTTLHYQNRKDSDSGDGDGGKDKDPGTDKPDTHDPKPGTDGGGNDRDRSKDFGSVVDIHDEDIPLATTLLTLLDEDTPLTNLDIPDTGLWKYFWIIQFIPSLCLAIVGVSLIAGSRREEE